MQNGVTYFVVRRILLQLPLQLPTLTHAIEEHDNKKHFIRNVSEEEVEYREIDR